MKNVQKPIYPIDFHAITVGERQEFEWAVDEAFFGHWPESEVSVGRGRVHAEVLRHASMLELTVGIEAEVELICDRCLEPFWQPVSFRGNPVVRLAEDIPQGESYDDNQGDGELLWISPMDQFLDLGQYVYESIILSLPFQRVHPRLEECNPDMLNRFSIETEEETEEEEK